MHNMEDRHKDSIQMLNMEGKHKASIQTLNMELKYKASIQTLNMKLKRNLWMKFEKSNQYKLLKKYVLYQSNMGDNHK